MSKGAGKQTVTQKLDPQTAAMQAEVFRRAQAAANQPYTPYQGQTVAGVSDLSSDAAKQFEAGSMLTGLGASALAGNPDAFSRFMNPYQRNVIDALGQSYDRQRGQAALDANDAATRAGAFGGDRHALLVGERQGALDRAQMQDTANLLYGGFNDANQRALQAANFGLGSSQQAFNAGDYFRDIQQQYLTDQQNRFNEARDWDIRNLDILKGALTGTPYGQTQETPLYKNVGAGILGGAATGAQIGSAIPGVGTALGAGIGGLIGLF